MNVFRKLMVTVMLSLPLSIASTANVWAEEAEQEQEQEQKSYKLEQMRKQSQANEKEPEVQMPEEDSDLVAGSDEDTSQHYDQDYSDIGDIKPEFDKPKIEPYKSEE